MRYILLILASSLSLMAHAVLPQASRPYSGSYGQAHAFRQWQQPNRGFQTYAQPYYDPYYAPYQPDNGPMRGRNSIQGHQRNFFYP